MKSTYLIWKNPPRNGETPDWQEITGKQFYSLVSSPEGKNRYFVKLASTDQGGGDGTIIMEATQADYIEWKREKNHSDYLRNYNKKIEVISYHHLESKDGECAGEELLRDGGCDVEGENLELLIREEIRAAVSRLSSAEQELLEYLYLSDKQGTERGYSALTGIPQKTINDRKKRAFKKIFNFLS